MIAARTSLDRLLDPIFTQDVARRVIDFRPASDVQLRLEDLRVRANEGLLTDEERVEYEQFVETLDMLAVLKVRARAALDR